MLSRFLNIFLCWDSPEMPNAGQAQEVSALTGFLAGTHAFLSKDKG